MNFFDGIAMHRAVNEETEYKTVIVRSNIRNEDSLTSFGNPVPAQFLNLEVERAGNFSARELS